MRYIWQHIQIIVETYNGSLPLSHFLKDYFKQYPKLGSRDRRVLSEMAYCWYRCAKGIQVTESTETESSFEEKMRSCLQLCGNKAVVQVLYKGEEATITMLFDRTTIFPYPIQLSDGLTKEKWLDSLLLQPDLFIRIRKEKDKIISILNQAGIPFRFVTSDCLSLPNGAKIDTLLPAETYVVQDASSQATGTFFKPNKNEKWYDCCSGAGGKSLLLKDLEPSVQLTVTDVRASILNNLKERFKLYGHKAPVAIVTDVCDLVNLNKALGKQQFDHIICDAPCSGSGTWARTPEQMYFFDPATIVRFNNLQKSIAVNVSRYLKPGGRLIYITCSVFREENEAVVAAIIRDTGLTLLNQQLIDGTEIHADCMFLATLQK